MRSLGYSVAYGVASQEDGLGQIGTDWDRLGQIGTDWDRLGWIGIE